jgi:hypothetical protein
MTGAPPLLTWTASLALLVPRVFVGAHGPMPHSFLHRSVFQFATLLIAAQFPAISIAQLNTPPDFRTIIERGRASFARIDTDTVSWTTTLNSKMAQPR